VFNGLGDLALDRKNIPQIALVALRPDVGVSAGVDEFGI
jgi:hypothetical protein